MHSTSCYQLGRNLGQVETWMAQLDGEAKKKKDDPLLRGVAPMLHLVERMLATSPRQRPGARAREVLTRMYEILHDVCGTEEPHCVHRYYEGCEDLGMDGLRIREEEEEERERMSVVTRRSSTVPSPRLRQTGSGFVVQE